MGRRGRPPGWTPPRKNPRRRERGLYRRLLDLGRQDEPEPFLREALGLIVEVTGARHGYLELHDDDRTGTPRWALAHGFTAEQLAGVRAAISGGIIAEAVATGKTIVTPSALLDERFRARESVRIGQIEAVLCAPIGDDPPRGVLYLQNRAGHGFFSEDDRVCAETFARHLAPLVDRVLARQRERAGMDATAPVRARLRAPDVIGRGTALATALHHVALVAPLDVHVLLTGETGTGKSQLARVIHDNGPRATHPFVTLNCAALPETLIESELFGALPGAHSTATRRIAGKVESAERGTLIRAFGLERRTTRRVSRWRSRSRSWEEAWGRSPPPGGWRTRATTRSPSTSAAGGSAGRERAGVTRPRT